MNELFHVLITYGGIRKWHVKGKKRFTNTTSAGLSSKGNIHHKVSLFT